MNGDATAIEGRPKDNGLLSVPETARRLNLNAKTVRKAIKAGELKSVKLANAIRVPAAEVERLLAATDV